MQLNGKCEVGDSRESVVESGDEAQACLSLIGIAPGCNRTPWWASLRLEAAWMNCLQKKKLLTRMSGDQPQTNIVAMLLLQAVVYCKGRREKAGRRSVKYFVAPLSAPQLPGLTTLRKSKLHGDVVVANRLLKRGTDEVLRRTPVDAPAA